MNESEIFLHNRILHAIIKTIKYWPRKNTPDTRQIEALAAEILNEVQAANLAIEQMPKGRLYAKGPDAEPKPEKPDGD